MKKSVVFIIVIFLFVLFIVPSAFAQNIEVVGKVDNPNTSTLGSSVIFKDVTSQATVTTTVNPDGSYATSVPQGTYDVSVVPPIQSGLLPITKYNQQVTANEVENFSVATSPNYLKGKQSSSTSFNITLILGIVTVMVGLGIGYLFWKRR